MVSTPCFWRDLLSNGSTCVSGQEKTRGQSGKLGTFVGICEFPKSIFRHPLNGSRFPETSANGQCDVTGRHRNMRTSHCVKAAVEYSV